MDVTDGGLENGRGLAIDSLLGARVRALRASRGFSRADLARRMRVHPSALQRFEDGAARMSAEDLYQICRSLRATPSG